VLSGFNLSRDGQSGAFIGQSPTHPPEVYFMKHGDAAPRRLTDSNPWLFDIRLAPQEVVRYKARDGVELEGMLIRPQGAEDGQKHPLVLVVHGGPESHYSNGWLTRYANPGQVLAARGFAVFYPNYRGSTGRGVEFSKAGQSDPAGREFDDLVDGVDHLIKIGLVDKDKVGVTGGSYGGYATAWCSTYYSERFAAGVMFVGISDLVSKAGTTDIPNEMYLVHERNWPWEDWAEFRERSPIHHVQKARTPLLIVHGKDDPRVHPSQSLELYRYSKMAGKTPVRLVWYPGEGHGNRKAAAQLDLQLRLLDWMEHYLKGPGGKPPPHALKYELPGETATQPATTEPVADVIQEHRQKTGTNRR
jgi:dipeptidyl aminopeptidase/acylaminoacyl peptidase